MMQLTKITFLCIALGFNPMPIRLHQLVQHDAPVRCLKGWIVDANGNPIRFVDIAVFTNPGVWLDDSLDAEQKRSRQKQVATTTADENGKFSLKSLHKGPYEIEFDDGRFNVLSAIVQVDPAGNCDNLCVRMATGGGDGHPSFKPCKE